MMIHSLIILSISKYEHKRCKSEILKILTLVGFIHILKSPSQNECDENRSFS